MKEFIFKYKVRTSPYWYVRSQYCENMTEAVMWFERMESFCNVTAFKVEEKK